MDASSSTTKTDFPIWDLLVGKIVDLLLDRLLEIHWL